MCWIWFDLTEEKNKHFGQASKYLTRLVPPQESVFINQAKVNIS